MNRDARRPPSRDVTMLSTIVGVGDGRSADQERWAAEARAQYVVLRRTGPTRYMALPCETMARQLLPFLYVIEWRSSPTQSIIRSVRAYDSFSFRHLSSNTFRLSSLILLGSQCTARDQGNFDTTLQEPFISNRSSQWSLVRQNGPRKIMCGGWIVAATCCDSSLTRAWRSYFGRNLGYRAHVYSLKPQ